MIGILNELKKFSSEIVSFESPIKDEKQIIDFEIKFNLKLPADYKVFIKNMNGFSLMAMEVYGIFPEGKKDDLISVYEYEHLQVEVPQFNYLVPFSPDGGGNFYCFDTRFVKNDNDACPVVFWVSNYEYTEHDQPEIVNSSFSDFVEKVIIGWTLEDYNYDGIEKNIP